MIFFQTIIFLVMSFSTRAEEISWTRQWPTHDNTIITETTFVTSYASINSIEHTSLVNLIGFVYPEFSLIKHTKSIEQKPYFDVNYKTGAFGLREIDKKLLNLKSDNHFILAGDSFIFGDGVIDEHTVGVKVSNLLRNYHVYNFGISGGAPNNTLALMENFPWQNTVRETKGVFVYNLELYYMLQRVVGSKTFMNWHDGISPYYVLNGDGLLERRGNLSGRPFINWFYRMLNSKEWLKDLIPELPRIGDRHALLVTAIFKRMKEIYLAYYPEGKFIVSLGASTYSGNKNLNVIIKEMFRKENIEFVEFTRKAAGTDIFLEASYDRHYNEKGNSLMASGLVFLLKKYNYILQ